MYSLPLAIRQCALRVRDTRTETTIKALRLFLSAKGMER